MAVHSLDPGKSQKPQIRPDQALQRTRLRPLPSLGSLAVKKPLIITSVVLGFAMLVALAALAWKAFTLTDPYLVKPLTSSPAPAGASIGHSCASGSRTLSIVSSNNIVVVADPGASFKYEVLWLVERPRKSGASTLMEYRCDLPQYAAADHINPIGSRIPPKIQQVADGGQW